MPDDVVFKLTTVYDGSQLASGMGASTSVITGSVAQWKGAFTTFEQESLDRLRSIDNGIRQFTVGVQKIPVATREAVEESTASLDLLQERFVRAAEVAKASATGIGGAFSGIGTLLGGGLLLGLLGHFLDETNKDVLALGRLSERTGASIESLAGLGLIARETGIEFETMQTALVRLGRAQSLAVEGGKTQEQAFRRIGLSINEIKGLSPEELFSAVSGAIQKTGSTADIAASSFELLGRGGNVLIPIFKQYGDNLGEVSQKLGEETGVTLQAYEESLKWQKATADIAEEIRKLGIEVLPIITAAIQYFVDGLHVLGTAIENEKVIFREFITDARSVGDAMAHPTDPSGWVNAYNVIRNAANEATIAIAQNDAALVQKLQADHAASARGGPANEPPSGAGAPRKDDRIEQWKLELQQREDASTASHTVMLSQEIAFWDNILQTQKLNAKQELEIRHTLATLNKEVTGEMQRGVMELYAEGLKSAGSGSQEEMRLLQEKYDFAVSVYGLFSSQAVSAYGEIATASRKAAEQELKDIEAVEKEHEKTQQKMLADEQKRLDETYKQQTAAIDQSTKAGVQEEGGSKGPLGAFVAISAETDAYNARMAAQQNYQAQSLALDQKERDEKIADLNVVKAAYLADSTAHIANAQADATKIKEIDTQILAAKEAEQAKETELTEKGEAQRLQISMQYQKQLQAAQQTMAQSFANEMDMMLFHAKNFGDAMQKLWQDMVRAIIEKMIMMVAQHVASQAVMASATAAGQAAQTASVGAGSASRSSIGIVEDLKSIGRAAATAAAHAFKWVMEEVPFPANAALAPAAAAGAFASVLAFGAAAEQGYDVPGGSGVYPTLLHPREMVLPSDLANRVRGMSSNQTSNSQSSSASSVEFNYHAGPVSALDGEGIGDILKKHPAELSRVVSGLLRSGHINPRGFAR